MKTPQEIAFVHRCIGETLSGVRDGLSRFSGESRTAVIFCLDPQDSLYILDPQNLMRGYEPKLEEIYQENRTWRQESQFVFNRNTFSLIDPLPNLQLDGRISYGGTSGSVFYQMWFTEHHPDMCSTGPTERWLEHAVLRFSHDIADEKFLYTGISGGFLREYATHAVHDYIVDITNIKLGLDTHIEIYHVLNSILGISKTHEERVRPHGKILFIEPRFIDSISFLARFRGSERPRINHLKHVRKLLQAVEDSNRKLISDGISILGVSEGTQPVFHLSAEFQGKIGFLELNREKVCSFTDGSYTSNTHRAKLFEVEEALLDYDLDAAVRSSLFQIIVALVHNAQNKMFGCTLVIDLADKMALISGQSIKPPIDLCRENQLNLACALSKVDGALHIRADLHLHAFACLLDGHTISGEDRARGARYNSALRFSAEHPKTIIVVVSSDRPVSVLQQGKKIRYSSRAELSPHCMLRPKSLDKWLAESR
ncbi:MAG: DNA-binding protein [Desulfobulbaceae bacterium]|nr:MAG: DNA-binding protein [Desulfobulbaceae bacterium]